MNRRITALIGALALTAAIPGLAFAHGYTGRWHGWRSWTGNHYDQRYLRDWGRDGAHGDSGSSVHSSQGSQGTSQGSGSQTSGSGSQTSGSGSQTSGSGSQGSGSAASAGQGGNTIDGYQIERTIHLTATAYAPTAQDNYPYGPVDYYGNALVAGDVAVDPSVIPLGTWLWVQGYSYSPYLPSGGYLAHAVDTGGAIKGDRIDLFINQSESIVNNFGIQPVTAYVLNKPLSK